jgi:FlaA1/EpsC-like NDP-sugar epimerase
MSNKSDFNLVNPILAMPRWVKRVLALLTDVSLCIIAVWLAFYLRLDEWVRIIDDPRYRPDLAAGVALLIAIPLFITHGFYRVIFRYSNLAAVNMVVRAFVLYGLGYMLVVTAIGLPSVPRSVGINQPLLFLAGIGFSRAVAYFWLGRSYRRLRKRDSFPKVMIYGAGVAGRQLASAMSNSQEMKVVGFFDDDESLQGQMMNGLRIHDPEDLASVTTDNGITTVLLALPSISRHRRNEILGNIKDAKVAVRTLPSVSDLAQGKITVSDLRELDIEDLLGREPVPPNEILLGKNIFEKTVLVTGAGGSIGSELCRQIADIGPKKLVLFEQSEHALYQIEAELQRRLENHSTELVSLLGSVQDERHMTDVMASIKPDTVYHAAAYKHVPLVEHNPTEGLKNNVFGTLVTAQAAIAAGVTDFVLISTDKAVRPTNVMGASKRLAEMVLQALAHEQSQPSRQTNPQTKTQTNIHTSAKTQTRLSMVRFGNVLGSSGSVVPKFRQQIREGGPVTVTHYDVTRYFMTIPEAAQLVIQAGAMAKGGDVYVLDMGKPVKIFDLAKRMIELSGLTVRDANHPTRDIEISITGLRPGEKLYEELLIGDNPQSTTHPRIMRASEEFLSWPVLQGKLEVLREHLEDGDATVIKGLLRELVLGYHSSGGRKPSVSSTG